jgi:hypothetical protein
VKYDNQNIPIDQTGNYLVFHIEYEDGKKITSQSGGKGIISTEAYDKYIRPFCRSKAPGY